MPPAGVGAGRLQARSTRPCPPGTAKLAPPSPSRQHERPSGRPAIIFFMLCFALFCKKRASNVQCTLCCCYTWRCTCLIWCYIWVVQYYYYYMRRTNRPCAAARCVFVSCMHCMWAHVQWACAWRHISTPRSRATFQDREMLIKIMVRWWKEHSSTSTIMQSGHGNFISKWF